MKRICLFAASAMGARASYAEAAAEFGRTVAERGIGLVYGGCAIGLMTTAADAALAAGGEVIGVIPAALVDLEIAHRGLTELKIVGSMHERKATMAELSDGFAALARRPRHAGGDLRGADLVAARISQKALRPAQHRGLLRSASRLS